MAGAPKKNPATRGHPLRGFDIRSLRRMSVSNLRTKVRCCLLGPAGLNRQNPSIRRAYEEVATGWLVLAEQMEWIDSQKAPHSTTRRQ
jgi:hypothetical protein